MLDLIGLIYSIKKKSRFSKYAIVFFASSLASQVYTSGYSYLIMKGILENKTDTPVLNFLCILPAHLFSIISIASLIRALYKLE